jgi:RNA polymerase II elongation factor ELL
VKRGAKTSKAKLLPSAKGSTFTTTISRSGAASPALSSTGSPSLGATLSADELAKDRAKELRSPIVHELAVREMTFEELQSRWPNDDSDFKPALDKVADFDGTRQKYTLKRMYWKELDVFRYGYDSDEERQKAIDNAIKIYDRMRVGTTELVWQKLLPKEERGKGKCLSKLQATIAKSAATAQAKTPQIKVHDAEDSSGSRNGDGNLSGVERKTKKAGSPLPRSSSQTRQPAKKTESKLLPQKKALTPKVSPTKAGAKTAKAKAGRVLSKEIISDSDSSSEDAPMSKTVAKSKAADMEREKAKERERERERAEREKEREKAEREKERAREREREREREGERERERERAEREKEREREREREKARQAEKARQKEAAAAKPKPKPAAPKEIIKPQVVARPVVQKRSREEHDDDSSSSSGTPLSKRVNREVKATTAPSSKLANKRPPSDSSSQGSSRSNGNAGNSLPSKYKNTSPIKSSPLASSPPTNASDFDHTSTDESRHGRQRDRSQDRSVTVANGSIIVKKRKAQAADRDTIDVVMADKKRQRVSTEILDKARRFKMHYVVYQQLHRELSRAGSFNKEKYEKLMEMHESLEDLKSSIYSQVPQHA